MFATVVRPRNFGYGKDLGLDNSDHRETLNSSEWFYSIRSESFHCFHNFSVNVCNPYCENVYNQTFSCLEKIKL